MLLRKLKKMGGLFTIALGCFAFSSSCLAGGFPNHHYNQHRNHTCCHQKFGTPDHQHWNFCCPERAQPPNHVLYIKQYFPYFYNIVTQNSPKSCAKNNICVNGMLCVSGIANFDLVYNNRAGTPFQLPGGSWIGTGVRPLFGSRERRILIGSINNVDLFLDAALNNWVTGHFDFAYVNASRRVRNYAHEETDWGSAYRSAAGLKVNQAYLMFANPACMPFYIQVGRYNSAFGDYHPFPVTPTLPQLLSETRTGGVTVGAIFKNGFYAQAFWNLSEQSLERFNGFETGSAIGPKKEGNYGGKIGFRSCVMDDFFVHVNVSYTDDMRDADYLLEADHFFNVEFRKNIPFSRFAMRNQYVKMCKAAGLSLHGNFDYKGFGLTADYVKALSGLSDNPYADTKVYAYAITGHANFPLFTCRSTLELSYQGADCSDVTESFIVQNSGFPNPPPIFGSIPLRLGNVLPCSRIQATYHVNVMPHIYMALQWVHDKDFGKEDGGTGNCSDFYIMRLSGEF